MSHSRPPTGVLLLVAAAITLGPASLTVMPHREPPPIPGPLAPIFEDDPTHRPWTPSDGPVITDGKPLPEPEAAPSTTARPTRTTAPTRSTAPATPTTTAEPTPTTTPTSTPTAEATPTPTDEPLPDLPLPTDIVPTDTGEPTAPL